MAKANPLKKPAAALKDFAMKLPSSVEEFPWGHSAFKVKTKTFLFTYLGDDFLSMSMKLPSSGRMALLLPFVEPAGYGLARSGWVTAKFAPTDEVPVDRLCEWVEESYRAVAPKKLVAKLDNPGEPKPATIRKRNS